LLSLTINRFVDYHGHHKATKGMTEVRLGAITREEQFNVPFCAIKMMADRDVTPTGFTLALAMFHDILENLYRTGWNQPEELSFRSDRRNNFTANRTFLIGLVSNGKSIDVIHNHCMAP
jgi:hypothetical protein